MTLKLVCTIARGVDNHPTNFGVSRTFHSRLIGQHLPDALRDLATLIFEVMALVTDAGLHAPFVPSLEFVGLPIRKILGIYCVSISWPGDLDLLPFNL